MYIGPSFNAKYVIKKGRPHGHKYGKTPEKKENYQAHNYQKEIFQKDPRSVFE